MQPSAISFGIGTIVVDARAATAVIVNDRVITLQDIVRRYSTPDAPAPLMREFMPQWQRWQDWLRRLELQPSLEDGWQSMHAVKFMAPVTEPGNIFHTYHNYHRRSSSSGLFGPSKTERVLPDVFFGSRSALAGHGDTIYREHGGVQFDFELELTAVIGKTAERVSAEHAEQYIAGYTIANDLTMHSAWWKKIREQSRLNDNIRMKNFPGYTPMGPAIVPADLVGDPNSLSLQVTVDGQLRQDTNTSKMLWKINELIEYLSWISPLQPGDLILSGSAEELPLPPGHRRGIKVGQTVSCCIAKLGCLENHIEEQTFSQPGEIPVASDHHD